MKEFACGIEMFTVAVLQMFIFDTATPPSLFVSIAFACIALYMYNQADQGARNVQAIIVNSKQSPRECLPSV